MLALGVISAPPQCIHYLCFFFFFFFLSCEAWISGYLIVWNLYTIWLVTNSFPVSGGGLTFGYLLVQCWWNAFWSTQDAACFVLEILVILEVCTDVVGFYQHGGSANTQPLNLNVSKGSGKSLQKQVMIIDYLCKVFSSNARLFLIFSCGASC